MTDMGTLYTFQTKLESLVYYLFVQRTRFENICNKQISTNLFYSIAMNWKVIYSALCGTWHVSFTDDLSEHSK
jgi:hypothetical protein